MADRSLVGPRSNAQNTRIIRREQANMSDGVYNDIPASKVPANGLYNLSNAIALPWGVQGRTGAKLISLELPAELGESPTWRFKARQSGTTVTWETGTCLSSYERKYIWWPSGDHDLITAVNSSSQMTVATTAVRESTSGCKIRAEINALMWHSSSKLLILHIGTRIYYSTYPPYGSSENVAITYEDNEGTIHGDTGMPAYTLTQDDERRNVVQEYDERCFIKSVVSESEFITEGASHDQVTTTARISSWVPIYRNAKRLPSDAKSTLREYGDDAVLFCSNGMFLIRLSQEYPTYCLLNESQPLLKPEDDSEIENGYERRVTMAYSAIDGSGLRDRSRSSLVSLESANTSLRAQVMASSVSDINSYGKDFWTSRHASPIDATNYREYDLPRTQLMEIGYHWTHMTLYGTLDVGVHGIDPLSREANNSERFYWMDDIPRNKVFMGIIGSSAGTLFKLTSNNPIFSEYDLGSTIHGGSQPIVIGEYESPSVVWVSHSEIIGSDPRPLCIGSTRVGVFDTGGLPQTGVRRAGSTSLSVTASDVGKLIWFSDGTVDVITHAGGKLYGVYDIEWIRARDIGGLAFAIDENYSGSVTTPTRLYRDIIPDNGSEGLRVRDGFLMATRFFTPMPCGDIGGVVPGFIWVGNRGDKLWYYCCTGDRRFAGYHHPQFQADCVDSEIIALSEFENVLVGYGQNGFVIWDLSDTKSANDESPESTMAPLGRNPIVFFRSRKDIRGIGVCDPGAVQKTHDGFDICVTQNREVRIFDGYKFGSNLLAQRYQRKFDELQSYIATHFDKRTGFLVFGTRDSLKE